MENNGWMKVTDKLPEWMHLIGDVDPNRLISKQVLILLPSGEMRLATYERMDVSEDDDGSRYEDFFDDSINSYSVKQVIGWLPIPEVPENFLT